MNLSGWSLRERVTCISEIGVNEVLLNDSLQFDAHNLFHVTQIELERKMFYGYFCNPDNPFGKRQDNDMQLTVHEFELAPNSKNRFYHAVPAGSAPSLPPDSDFPPLPDIGPLLLAGTSKEPHFADWLQ